MVEYLKKLQRLMKNFEKVELRKLPREENKHAKALKNIASAVHLREENHTYRVCFRLMQY